MAPKSRKRGGAWPMPRFNDDPDIRAYAASAIKELEALKKRCEHEPNGMPIDIANDVVAAFLHLAHRVKDAPTNEQLAQRLARVELSMEKTQKEVSQASREINTTKSNTNRLVEVICHTPPSSRVNGNKSYSHVTASSESYVQGWGRRVPSYPPTVPSVGVSSGNSSPLTPFPAQEDLEIYLERTDADTINPLRRFPDQVIHRANLAIQSTQDVTIAHRHLLAARVQPSGDIILLAATVDDVDQLTRKNSWTRTFGPDTRIRKRTWGVVVHSVSTNIDPKQEIFKTTLASQNAAVFAHIPAPFYTTYVGWLLSEQKIQELKLPRAHLVVMFDDERVANLAIRRGLIINGFQHAVSIYNKAANLQQCFKCQMYKHIARHCQRQTSCAYCAGSHDTGECPTPKEKEYAKCANCAAENVHIKDPIKKLDEKHFAYSRDCPIRASYLAEAHEQRTHGLQYHPEVVRPGNRTPGVVSSNDPTPAEAALAANERSPRTETRTDPSTRRRSAPSRSKSTAARKRTADPGSPSRPNTRAQKKTIRVQDEGEEVMNTNPEPEAPVDPRSLIVYEDRTRKNRPKAKPTDTILQSDIVSLQSQVESIRPIRRARSARVVPDDESEDELSRSDYDISKPTGKPSEPGDTLMTTNLEDSTWANSQ